MPRLTEKKEQLQFGQLYWSSAMRNLLVMFVGYMTLPSRQLDLIVPRCLVLARKNESFHAPGKVVILVASQLVKVSTREASIPLALTER